MTSVRKVQPKVDALYEIRLTEKEFMFIGALLGNTSSYHAKQLTGLEVPNDCVYRLYCDMCEAAGVDSIVVETHLHPTPHEFTRKD